MSVAVYTFLIFVVSVVSLVIVCLVLSDKLHEKTILYKQYEKWWLESDKQLREYDEIFNKIRDNLPF